MEIQTINLSANAPQVFLAPGKFIEVIEAPYPLSIAFFDREGNALADGGLVNTESGLFVDMLDGAGWGSIIVTSVQAQTVKLLIGSMRGGSRRQPGTVSVIDGGRTRTMTGLSFCEALSFGPVAAQFARCALWNPATSGRRIVIKRVSVSSQTQQGITVGTFGAVPASPVLSTGGNKLAGSSTTITRNRVQDSAVTFAGLIQTLVNVTVPAILQAQYLFDDPVVIPPGFGIAATPFAVNTDLFAVFEGHEEAI